MTICEFVNNLQTPLKERNFRSLDKKLKTRVKFERNHTWANKIIHPADKSVHFCKTHRESYSQASRFAIVRGNGLCTRS
jgi:hypothetical protein